LREELQSVKRKSFATTNNKENLKHATEIMSLKRENLNLKQTIKRLENEKDQLNNQIEKQKQLLSKFELVEINMKKYQLICKIGCGGFSEVFKCISIDTKESVALKKVTINDNESVQLIKNEIDLLIKLKNSNKVVNLLDQ
jgi:predicted RNase H-like nuclease (RuvC/YqgF family)